MDFFNQINRILLCAIVAVAVSILYCFLVQLIPMAMNYFSVIIGLIIMFTVLIITFLYPSSRALKICVLTILLLMIIMIIFIVVQNKGNLKYHAVFLKYSARMVADRPGVIVYILIFMAALFLFVFIVLVELRAFWSSGKLVFDMNNIYYEFTPKTTIIWTCVVAVQAIWGISFLKEACN